MSDDDTPNREVVIERLIKRLGGLARGLGLDEAAMRRIVDKIALEMPDSSDDERLDAARQHMIMASA